MRTWVRFPAPPPLQSIRTFLREEGEAARFADCLNVRPDLFGILRRERHRHYLSRCGAQADCSLSSTTRLLSVVRRSRSKPRGGDPQRCRKIRNARGLHHRSPAGDPHRPAGDPQPRSGGDEFVFHVAQGDRLPGARAAARDRTDHRPFGRGYLGARHGEALVHGGKGNAKGVGRRAAPLRRRAHGTAR